MDEHQAPESPTNSSVTDHTQNDGSWFVITSVSGKIYLGAVEDASRSKR